MDKTAQLGAS